MPKTRTKPSMYAVFLHLTLVALAAFSLFLLNDNQELRAGLSPSVPQLEAGAQVDAVAVTRADGTEDVLSWDAAGRDRLLFVFTTTCPACQQNQDAWRDLHASVGDAVDVVGISLSDAQATAGYREALDLPFEVVLPAQRDAFTTAFEVSVVPFTFHIAADGTVRGAWRGGLDPERLAEVEAGALAGAQQASQAASG